MVAVYLVRGAHLDGCRQSRRSGEENTGCTEDRLGAVGDSGRVGDRDVDVLAPGEVDDACISADIASVPLDDAAIAVMLHVLPCPRGLKVSVPSLRVSSKVSCAALVGGGKNESLSGEDTAEDAVAGGDDDSKSSMSASWTALWRWTKKNWEEERICSAILYSMGDRIE
jgi:hypothetical protein